MTEKRSARIAMGWKRIGLMRRPATGGEDRERDSFLCHRKVHPMTEKRSARIAMRRKRILSQKRPAAGEEDRERASFLPAYSGQEALCGFRH